MTVCQFRHVHTLMFESRASHVVDSLGVAHVLTDKRRTGREESLYANRRETVPRVINS